MIENITLVAEVYKLFKSLACKVIVRAHDIEFMWIDFYSIHYNLIGPNSFNPEINHEVASLR